MDNLFVKCGFVLKHGTEPNQLTQDQVLFQKQISDSLKRLSDNPRVIQDLLEDLSNYIDDKNKFFFALQTTIFTENRNSMQLNQNSLFHLLLGVNLLQKSVMTMLFDKLAELSGMDEFVTWNGDNFSLTQLIVKQFRHLDKLTNSEDLCSKVLEILEIVTVETQQNIIGCLPEIFNDECHPVIAKSLCGFLNSYSPLTVHVLDALSSLNVSVELLNEIEDSAALATAWLKTEHLPVVIRFLFNTCGERNKDEIVKTLRKNLVCNVFPKNSHQVQRMNSEERNQVVVILDQLKFFIQTKRSVAESWIQVINNDNDSENEVMDFLVILILHSVSSKGSVVEVLLRNKMKAGFLNEKSLSSIFESYFWALKDYFDVMMKAAAKFVKLDKQIFSSFGTNVYKNAFIYFDFGYKQIVVENLLSHFSSYKSSEIESTIELLRELTENQPTQMASFAVYIKRILDYFDRLPLQQIRLIYSCLSILACKGGREGELLQNDLQTIVQKQLTNSDLKYKRIGIVGSLMLIKHLAPSKDNTEFDNTKRGLNLLQLLYAAVKNDKSALSLFFDVVSSLTFKQELGSEIEQWISEKVIVSFQDNFIVDVESCTSQELQFSLDTEDVEDGIAVNLFPLITNEENVKENKRTKTSTLASPVNLCPQFRLLQINEKVNTGNLESIDALLGCPVKLFPMEKLNDFNNLSLKEKNLICSALFYTLNWFREIINAFASQSDVEMREKVINRLKNVTHLQNVLKKCLMHNPCYRPPIAHFDAEEKIITVSVKRKKEQVKKKSKKQKTNDSSNESQDVSISSSLNSSSLNATADTGKKNTTKKEKEKEPPTIQLSQYAQHFRELDFTVFELLQAKMSIQSSDSTLTQNDDNSLGPEELNFLLEDLKCKLEFILSPPSESHPFGHKGNKMDVTNFVNLSALNVNFVMEKTVDLMPHLCSHLESASEYFQVINAEVMDSISSRSELSLSVARCFKFLVDCLTILFSWKEFDQHRSLQTNAISNLSNRLSSSGKTQLDMNDNINRALDYVLKFSESVPNFSSAVAILSLAEKLTLFNKTDVNLARLSKTADDFLRRPWVDKNGEPEKGTKHNEELQRVLTLRIQVNPDSLELIQTLVTVALPELTESQVESSTYRTMTKSSFSLYYRVMFSNLVKEVKKFESDKSDLSDEVILLRWSLAVRIFQILVNAVKVFGNQTNFISCLKNSRAFVENFLKLGMPLLDSTFRRHKDDIISLLKEFQIGTRFLQHLCCHAKMIKQIAIVKNIPLLKKNLEAFLYRVKATLALHNCQDAFWMGNLKNKNIQGEEIKIKAEDGEKEGSDVENQQIEDGGNETDEIPDELLNDNDDNEEEIIDDEEEEEEIEGSYSQSY